MKLKNIIPQRYRSQIVRLFGDAKLICHSNGSHELIGGTPADLIAAREWCSFYAHDLVFSVAHSPAASRAFAA